MTVFRRGLGFGRPMVPIRGMRGLIQGKGVGSRAPVRSFSAKPVDDAKAPLSLRPSKGPGPAGWNVVGHEACRTAREDSSDLAGRFCFTPTVIARREASGRSNLATSEKLGHPDRAKSATG